ncbi:YggT family protein [Mycoplasmatota bacterium WC44]
MVQLCISITNTEGKIKMQNLVLYTIYFLLIYKYMILIYVLLSWFPNFREGIIYKFFETLCDPYIQKFRRIIPPIAGMDFSPLIGFFLIEFAIRGLASIF